MHNEWKELSSLNPRLKEMGIDHLGYYSFKTAKAKLEKGHHGSAYEICFLETGKQPYYVFYEEDAVPASWPCHTHGDSIEEGTLFLVQGGDVFLTRPYQVHSTGSFCQQRGRLWWIQIDSESTRLFGQSEECTAVLKQALNRCMNHIRFVPQSITFRLIEAFRLLLNPTEKHICRACCLLTLFVLELSSFNDKCMEPSNLHNKLSPKAMEAVDFIKTKLLDPDLNPDSLANHLHYSRSYTMAFFKKETGVSVHEFITRTKIEYACTMLNANSVTSVAALLNFSSSQHFSKVFKEQVGISPSQFKIGASDHP